MNNKKNSMYCISCDINGSTEPNFNCIMCRCQKCSKKDTECKCAKNPDRHDWCRKCNSKLAKYQRECNCRLCLSCNNYKNETKWNNYKKETKWKLRESAWFKEMRRDDWCDDCNEIPDALYERQKARKRLCSCCKTEKDDFRWHLKYNWCYECYKEKICFCCSHKNGYCYHCEYGDFFNYTTRLI